MEQKGKCTLNNWPIFFNTNTSHIPNEGNVVFLNTLKSCLKHIFIYREQGFDTSSLRTTGNDFIFILKNSQTSPLMLRYQVDKIIVPYIYILLLNCQYIY